MKSFSVNILFGILSLIFFSTGLIAQNYDILIKGGKVIDAKNDINGIMDVAIFEGKIALVDENIPADRQQFQIKLDCRYQKQYHEVSVLVEREWIEAGDSASIHAAFHAEHDRLYGYSLEEQNVSVDLINVRLQAIGITEKLDFREQDFAGEDASAALKGERDMYIFSEKAFRPVKVYDGHKMRFGNRVTGPAMIEQVTTAILVSDAYDCVVDQYGSFAVYEKGREDLLGTDMSGGAV